MPDSLLFRGKTVALKLSTMLDKNTHLETLAEEKKKREASSTERKGIQHSSTIWVFKWVFKWGFNPYLELAIM